MLLIDADCNNVAETVAAVLSRTIRPPCSARRPGAGRWNTKTAPISPTHALRFASAEMRLPDGSSLFRKGLAPDIAAPFEPETKGRVFAAHATQGVKTFITSPERPHHNERALVTRTAPELDYQLAKSGKLPTEFDAPPLQDRVLLQAVDVRRRRGVSGK